MGNTVVIVGWEQITQPKDPQEPLIDPLKRAGKNPGPCRGHWNGANQYGTL